MFGVGAFELWLARRGRMAAAVLLCPLLAGCSASLSSVSSLFGSSPPASTAAAAATNASAAAGELPMSFECPDVQVRQGAATLTSSANPAEPTALNLRYQVSISTTARECHLLPGNTVSIKVGMQGRVILGPEGHPGPVDVPIRFAVVREGVDPKPITTRLDRVAVEVPPDDPNVLFTHVAEGLQFPLPKGNEIDAYVIYVGFDPAGLHEPARKKPRAAPRRNTAAAR
jgi:hypothetical protein